MGKERKKVKPKSSGFLSDIGHEMFIISLHPNQIWRAYEIENGMYKLQYKIVTVFIPEEDLYKLFKEVI